MSIQDDIGAALRQADVQAYQQYALQGAEPPYTVYRVLESSPLMTLNGELVSTNSVFVFWNIAKTPAGAVVQRDLVAAAVMASATLREQCAVQVTSGEAEYEQNTNEPIEPCAFSFWH